MFGDGTKEKGGLSGVGRQPHGGGDGFVPLDDGCDLPEIAYGFEAALEAVECSSGMWLDTAVVEKPRRGGAGGAGSER